MANALTLLRLLLVAPFWLLMATGDAATAVVAALVLAVAVATDVADGRVARRRGTARPAGALFDHATDCLFVTGGLAGAATRGAVPWVLPALVAAAFVQYVVDSYGVHRHRGLRGSRLGRWNGILYFVPLGVDVIARAGMPALGPMVRGLAWALVVTTLLAMGERLRLSRRAREQLARRAPHER